MTLPGRRSVPVGDGGEVETLPVVPDAWIVFERAKAGGRVSYRVLLEVDRGTMYRQRIKRHVRARIEFVRSGRYERMLGTKAVLIVYATTGESVEDMESRRRSPAAWTMEVLEEMRLSKWAGLFRFCALSFGEMYKGAPFAKRVWYLPDQERPVGLFEA